MWYMHRNCAVHNGGCICGVLPKCKKVCELITREHIKVQKGIETQQNVLLTTIRETISIILLSETNIKKIIPGVHKVRKREFLGIDNK